MRSKIVLKLFFLFFIFGNCFSQVESKNPISFQRYFDSLVENSATLDYYLKDPPESNFLQTLKTHSSQKCLGKLDYTGFELKSNENYFSVHAIKLYRKSKMEKLLIELKSRGEFLSDTGKTKIRYHQDGNTVYFYLSARMSVSETEHYLNDFITEVLN